MLDQTPIHRHWLLLRMLSARRYGLTIREMANEASVGEKTIRRDLDLFRDLAFPLEATVSAFGRKTYRMTAAIDVPPLGFSVDEALALYLSRGFLQPLAGTKLWEAVQNAFGKIRAVLGDPVLAYAERMSCFFHATRVGVSDYGPKANTLDALTQVIEESRVGSFLPVGPSCRAGFPRRPSLRLRLPPRLDEFGGPRHGGREHQALQARPRRGCRCQPVPLPRPPGINVGERLLRHSHVGTNDDVRPRRARGRRART